MSAADTSTDLLLLLLRVVGRYGAAMAPEPPRKGQP